MDEQLLIIHGYSDASVSFKELRNFFVKDAGFAKENVYHMDYASMDDDATFRDFADKLDADFKRKFKGERINVACHSTGALVVRAWLSLRRERQLQLGDKIDCPVKRILMFAPANFGSDLASMGQSFLGKARTTFFNNFSYKKDFMESGRVVLQGLEPASPFQWDLSGMDLHGFDYFAPNDDPDLSCYPFIFAAGYDYADELQGKLLKARRKPGTDGTVRICGTNLNSRKCLLNFRRDGKPAKAVWQPENKFASIPFAVFTELNHGTIIAADKLAFRRRETGPKSLILKALKVESVEQYTNVAEHFTLTSKKNYTKAAGRYKDQYQQFFFRVRDDTNRAVKDFYIDFYVVDRHGKVVCDLTEKADEDLETKFYKHSVDGSCRALMLKHRKLTSLSKRLVERKASLVFDVSASSNVPNVSYKKGVFVILDGAAADMTTGGAPAFLYPNTTTLVDIVLNRQQTDKLANLKDHNLNQALPPPKQNRREKPTGRGSC